jgi:hypothetical protein
MAKFKELFLEQFALEEEYTTRSSKVVMPTHKAIGKQFEEKGYKVEYEYNFQGLYGEKKVDIAVFDKNNKLVSVVLFKGIRSNYNKNAHNYFEGARGETTLFLDSIPDLSVYHLVFIPTKIKKNERGILKWEIPSEKHYQCYYDYIRLKCVPKRMKMSIFYFDINYDDYGIEYANKPMPGRADTVTKDIDNYIKEYLHG